MKILMCLRLGVATTICRRRPVEAMLRAGYGYENVWSRQTDCIGRQSGERI